MGVGEGDGVGLAVGTGDGVGGGSVGTGDGVAVGVDVGDTVGEGVAVGGTVGVRVAVGEAVGVADGGVVGGTVAVGDAVAVAAGAVAVTVGAGSSDCAPPVCGVAVAVGAAGVGVAVGGSGPFDGSCTGSTGTLLGGNVAVGCGAGEEMMGAGGKVGRAGAVAVDGADTFDPGRTVVGVGSRKGVGSGLPSKEIGVGDTPGVGVWRKISGSGPLHPAAMSMAIPKPSKGHLWRVAVRNEVIFCRSSPVTPLRSSHTAPRCADDKR